VTPPSRCRILITTDAVGGVWTYSTTLARGLARRRYDVVLVTLGPPPRSEQLAGVADIEGVRVEVTDFDLEWTDPEGRDFTRARSGLANIARHVKPDVVHLNSYREALCQWPSPVLLVAHSCVRTWWRACRGTDPDEPRWKPYVARVKQALAACEQWIAPSAAFRDDLQAVYAPPSRGRVIHNGIAVESPIRSKEPFILAAGRLWDEAKNIHAILCVAGELPWPVRLAGSLQRGSHQLLASNIEYLGELPRADLFECMARAGVYVSPARYEPFGLCVLEAALARCALVLSHIPSLTELWRGAALFVEPADRRELTATLQDLCEDNKLRSRLQTAAAQRAARFSADAMVDRYCEIYDELISGNPREGCVEFGTPEFAPAERYACDM
jgi:glycosyltransferase involved in cell wall biosynthesis